MKYLYKPLYRPAPFSGIPKGWDYAEVPPEYVHKRPDVPPSTWVHGVIFYTRQLTSQECKSFELEYVGAEE